MNEVIEPTLTCSKCGDIETVEPLPSGNYATPSGRILEPQGTCWQHDNCERIGTGWGVDQWGRRGIDYYWRPTKIDENNIVHELLALMLSLPHREMYLFLADCVDHVMPIHEAKHPYNLAPQDANRARREFAEGRISLHEYTTACAASFGAMCGAVSWAAGHTNPVALLRDCAWAKADVARSDAEWRDTKDMGSLGERQWQYMVAWEYMRQSPMALTHQRQITYLRKKGQKVTVIQFSGLLAVRDQNIEYDIVPWPGDPDAAAVWQESEKFRLVWRATTKIVPTDIQATDPIQNRGENRGGWVRTAEVFLRDDKAVLTTGRWVIQLSESLTGTVAEALLASLGLTRVGTLTFGKHLYLVSGLFPENLPMGPKENVIWAEPEYLEKIGGR